MTNIYSEFKDKLKSIGDKIIVIENKKVLFYNKALISSGHLVYVPPASKYENEDHNTDEVLYLLKSSKKEFIGLQFIFHNTVNLQSLSEEVSSRNAISNVIYTIHRFKYTSIFNSIIINEISSPILQQDEIKIKGKVSNMKYLIEDYVDRILSTYCTRADQYDE